MFKSETELKEAFTIFSTAYNSSSMVYKKFKIEDSQIVFSGDSFFDPCIILSMMASYNIIESRIVEECSETDRVYITGCNIDLLRKLAPHLSRCTAKNLPKILAEIGYSDPPTVSTQMSTGVILEEGEARDHIDGPTWKKYWELRGQPAGPQAGWEIPTSADVYALIKLNASISPSHTLGTFFAADNSDTNKKLPYGEVKHMAVP